LPGVRPAVDVCVITVGRLTCIANVYTIALIIRQANGYTKMIEKRQKTAQVNLRMRPELKCAAEKAAADDHRSLTALFEKVLTDYLKEHGYLPSEDDKI